MVKQKHVDASLPPMIIVVILSTCFVAWCFWIGTVCVRLWFYKGSLGPEPEKFIIIPQHRKERVKAQQKHNTKTKRMTVFPVVKPELTQNPFADNAYPSANPFADDTYPAPALPQPTGSHVAGSGHYRFDDGLEGLTSLAEIKKVLAEEHRISRLPTFEQDDCGDGSHFPDVPYAYKSTSLRKARRSSTSSYNQARELLTLRLEKIEERNWLKVDNTYIGQWEARRELLAKSRKQCIQTRLDGEYACEELMKAVTNNLAENYPHYFKILDKGRTKHIKSDVTGIQYPLKRPFTFVPIEVCTRVAVEDFNVFVRDDFTQQWYLQASATLFPVGYRISRHIGKSLNAIVDDMSEPIVMWQDLPQILDLVSTTPIFIYTRTTTYIQTSPSPPASLSSILHITRAADLFAGNINALDPRLLLVRRETQTFRVLPDSGAVVMSTKTELRDLKDLDTREKEDLMVEIWTWDEEEASFKGRDLWITSVKGFCEGGTWRRDDRTVVSRC